MKKPSKETIILFILAPVVIAVLLLASFPLLDEIFSAQPALSQNSVVMTEPAPGPDVHEPASDSYPEETESRQSGRSGLQTGPPAQVSLEPQSYEAPPAFPVPAGGLRQNRGSPRVISTKPLVRDNPGQHQPSPLPPRQYNERMASPEKNGTQRNRPAANTDKPSADASGSEFPPPLPPDGDDPQDVPLDGGMLILLAAGATAGLLKLRQVKKCNQANR